MLKLSLLKPEVQQFIQENLKEDLATTVLKGSSFKDVSIQELAVQIEAKKKAEKKLPRWFSTSNIIFPKTLNLEQTSSEITAKYKADLIEGNSLIDLTGGFGIDSFYFSEKVKKTVHCEINEELSEIAEHNFKQLSADHHTLFYRGSGIDYLNNSAEKFDWIYIDPSRRSSSGKVFRLEDCEPDVLKNLNLFLEKAASVLIKTSPLLDLSLGLQQLKKVKGIHIVAVNNEVKELLWVLNHQASETEVKTINFTTKEKQKFSAFLNEEETNEASYKLALNYLYEPNAAIMKSGFFETVAIKYPVKKISKHSHLYTSEEQIDFPGRSFRIDRVIPFNKKNVKQLGLAKANISTRHFPMSVDNLRKKFSIKDGGKNYLFFTTDKDENKVVIVCEKV